MNSCEEYGHVIEKYRAKLNILKNLNMWSLNTNIIIEHLDYCFIPCIFPEIQCFHFNNRTYTNKIPTKSFFPIQKQTFLSKIYKLHSIRFSFCNNITTQAVE